MISDIRNRKPPKKRRNGEHDTLMNEWLFAKLDAYWVEIFLDEGLTPEKCEKHAERDLIQEKIKHAIYQYKHGDNKPLRRLSPQLADLLAKRRGKEFPTDHWGDAMSDPQLKKLTEAVWDAGRIRALLRENYDPLPVGYKSPEDIAAIRHAVEPDEVENWKASRRCPADRWPIRPPRLHLHFRNKTAPA
jgi:hypothetical protein